MVNAYLGIGSNIGDAAGRVRDAITRLGHTPGIELLRAASLFGSKPFGPVEQSDFVNTVVEIATDWTPAELLQRLKQLEVAMGRIHGVRWGPREIDLDILLYGDRRIQTADLELPHPGIAARAFVLAPLAQLCPDLRLATGISVAQACAELTPGLVWLLDQPRANARP